jgi:two-component system, cell cycle response regulator DivK
VAKHILVVEDNELNLKLFCDLLRAHGHQTTAIRDPREAVRAAQAQQPDLIITDIQLPHLSGLDLIHAFRADAALALVPVMAVTAYAEPGDEQRARSAGAQAYVSKPISLARFMEAVNALL